VPPTYTLIFSILLLCFVALIENVILGIEFPTSYTEVEGLIEKETPGF
jgi:hypothetical protein